MNFGESTLSIDNFETQVSINLVRFVMSDFDIKKQVDIKKPYFL